MHVITRKRLVEFAAVYPDAAQPLDDWFRLIKAGAFKTPADLKALFGSVSFLPKNVTVFNIGGNKYRLVVTVRYDLSRVYIRHVLTHKEYDERSANGTL